MCIHKWIPIRENINIRRCKGVIPLEDVIKIYVFPRLAGLSLKFGFYAHYFFHCSCALEKTNCFHEDWNSWVSAAAAAACNLHVRVWRAHQSAAGIVTKDYT